MASTTVLLSVGKLVGSFIIGIGLYYFLDSQNKNNKKQYLDDTLSLIIQFIVYIWLAKIALQLPMLVKSPFTVLAYPSNSVHFYIATGLTILHYAYKYRGQQDRIVSLFSTSSIIMLAAFFVYEFLQIITMDHHHINLYFIGVLILILVYVFLNHRVNRLKLAVVLFGSWLIMAGTISIFHDYFVLFQYMLKPLYFIILFLLLVLFAFYYGKQCSTRNKG